VRRQASGLAFYCNRSISASANTDRLPRTLPLPRQPDGRSTYLDKSGRQHIGIYTHVYVAWQLFDFAFYKVAKEVHPRHNNGIKVLGRQKNPWAISGLGNFPSS